MDIKFKNIDNWIQGPKQLIGARQPKFWYLYRVLDTDTYGKALVKRRELSKVHIDKNTVINTLRYNHYGEYVGYLLALKADMKVCPVDLVTVHATENKYVKDKNFYRACASHCVLKEGESLIAGTEVIEEYKNERPQEVADVLERQEEGVKKCKIKINSSWEDNIDIAILALEYKTRQAGECLGEQEVDKHVEENIQDFINMVVYDCLFGNYDRHSDNWSIVINGNNRVTVYPLYDHEGVLGLRKSKKELEKDFKENEESYAEEQLYSRMGINPENSGVSAKSMLEYLVKEYPQYAIPAMERITENVTEEYLDEIYNAFEGISERGDDSKELSEEDELPDIYRTLGKSVYHTRREFARNLIERYNKKSQESEPR